MMKIETNKPGRGRRGFSLLELMAVMSIIAMLSTIAVTSYFNAVRGMARRSAVKHLVNTLVLARQRATLDGTRTSVILFNEHKGDDEDGNPVIVPSYVVCKEIGTITSKPDSDLLIDEFENLDKLFNTGGDVASVGSGGGAATVGTAGTMVSMRLYNMTVGGWWEVKPRVEEKKLTARESPYNFSTGKAPDAYNMPAFAFVKNTAVANNNVAAWEVGHAYGIEAAPVNSLPRGILFGKLQEDPTAKAICVTFLPDGRAEKQETVRLEEKNPPKKGLSIDVSKTDGNIGYSENWE